MKCPLMLTYDVEEAPCEHPRPMDCLKEECAWWHINSQGCAVIPIADALNNIRAYMVNLSTIINERRLP